MKRIPEYNAIKINLENYIVVLKFEDFEDDINIDEITRIDYSNLAGESITISALLNRVGIMKAEAEYLYDSARLELDVWEAGFRKRERKLATKDGQKITEKGLEELVHLDPGYKTMKGNVYSRRKDLGIMDSLYWAVKSKDSKLSVLLKGITPTEFENEIVEGVVNMFFVQKVEKLIK